MVLSLDPRFPLVWRTPSSVQLGVASPVVVLHDVSAAVEGMLAALAAGVTRSGLDLIAREAAADTTTVDALLTELEPALLPQPGHAATPVAQKEPPTVLLVGSGPFIDRLALVLSTEGVATTLAPDASTEAAATTHCDLAIVSSHFVLAPQLHGTWLRRDIPHLSVVFSDTAVCVGPLVEPGVGPCLYCLERHRTDADPAWPAIAAQLWGRRSRLETPLNAGEVAHLAARLILERLTLTGLRQGAHETAPLAETGEAAHTTHTLNPATGEWSRTMATPHPNCGCVLLDVPARV
jgi:bacteriocin biosynthesis cyclodehydratase domain-containing protein